MSDREQSSGRRTAERDRHLRAKDLVNLAMEQLSQLTGKTAESVSALVQTDEGWRVTVEVVEVERIPPSTNVMGTYETEIDDEGKLVGYERIRRYHRNESDG